MRLFLSYDADHHLVNGRKIPLGVAKFLSHKSPNSTMYSVGPTAHAMSPHSCSGCNEVAGRLPVLAAT
eukprot:scaffold13336_cov201-Alexandrium_tamarense.AAC.13